MVPCGHSAMTQTLREPVLVPRRVLVSRPITALAAASPQRKVNIFGRRTSGPCGGRKKGPQGRNGSLNPLALGRRRTITEPLVLSVFYFLSIMDDSWPVVDVS